MQKIDQKWWRTAVLEALPTDGTTIGYAALIRELSEHFTGKSLPSEKDLRAVCDTLVEDGSAARGKGRGGSIRRTQQTRPSIALTAQEAPAAAYINQSKLGAKSKPTPQPKPKAAAGDPQVLSYRHADRRKNNPEVGMVTPDTDPDQPKTTWAYDPHIDPAMQFDHHRSEIENLIDQALADGQGEAEAQRGNWIAMLDHALAGPDERAVREVVANLKRQMESAQLATTERRALDDLKKRSAPYLNWAGKAERTSFEVDTVSLHVHERIDPMSILSTVRKAQGKAILSSDGASEFSGAVQISGCDVGVEPSPLRGKTLWYPKSDRRPNPHK